MRINLQSPIKLANTGFNRTTGTTLESGGSEKPAPNAFSEQGSATAATVRDIVPELANRSQAIQTYERMTNNDASVDVSLRAGKTPVLGATYFIQAVDEQQINQDIAEFVKFNLFESSTYPFLTVLEDILRMLDYGFSACEAVWELREWGVNRSMANRRKYTMLKKLAPRPASSVKNFLYDPNGGPNGLVQNAISTDATGKVTQKEVTIQVDKLLFFTFNRKGGALDGKSILRTAYKHWFYKDFLYKVDAIQKERHAIGVPKATLGLGYTEAEVKAAWELVTNLRTNEKAGMVLPPGVEVDFAELHGNLVNVLESVDHHDAHIMLNIMVQFLLMGIQNGGGKNTTGAQIDMFQKSLRYLANYICDNFNYYLIPKLVSYNFDTDKFPKMRVRNIGETKDLQMWASAMANLAAQNLITLDLETEQWVRENIDAPDKLGGKQTPEANGNGAGGGVGRGNVNTTNADDGTGQQSADSGVGNV